MDPDNDSLEVSMPVAEKEKGRLEAYGPAQREIARNSYFEVEIG